MSTVLRMHDACFDETGHGAIEDVDLLVEAGELVVAHGGEGTGKTVLARACLGFVEASRGEVELFGRPLRNFTHDDLLDLRARCALASSSAPLLSNLSLRDNIALPLVMRGLPTAGIDNIVNDVLERFDLTPLATVRPEDLLPRDRDFGLMARALAVPADFYVLDDAAFTPRAQVLLREKIRDGAAALAIVRHSAHFPDAHRSFELRAR